MGVEITVMTYNIHWASGPFKSKRDRVTTKRVLPFPSSQKNLDEIARVVRDSGADVVGLQEADGGSLRTRYNLLEPGVNQAVYIGGEELPYAFHQTTTRGMLGMINQGNSIVSRHPIRVQNDAKLPGKAIFSDRRGVIKATVTVQDREIDFYATHLNMPPNQKQFEAEISTIADMMRQGTNPAILLGDMNPYFQQALPALPLELTWNYPQEQKFRGSLKPL